MKLREQLITAISAARSSAEHKGEGREASANEEGDENDEDIDSGNEGTINEDDAVDGRAIAGDFLFSSMMSRISCEPSTVMADKMSPSG